MCAPHTVRGYNMIKKRNLVMKYALLDSRLNRVIVDIRRQSLCHLTISNFTGFIAPEHEF